MYLSSGECKISSARTLELFFDLVFGFLQVTYSWLTDAIPAEEILSERLVIRTAAASMFVVTVACSGAGSKATP